MFLFSVLLLPPSLPRLDFLRLRHFCGGKRNTQIKKQHVEEHAFSTYDSFLSDNEEMLKQQPAPKASGSAHFVVCFLSRECSVFPDSAVLQFVARRWHGFGGGAFSWRNEPKRTTHSGFARSLCWHVRGRAARGGDRYMYPIYVWGMDATIGY